MNLNNINLVLNNPELFLLIYKKSNNKKSNNKKSNNKKSNNKKSNKKESINKKLYMYKKFFENFQNIPITDLYNFTFLGVPPDNHCGFHVVLAGLQLFYPEYYNDVVRNDFNNITMLRQKTLKLWEKEPDTNTNNEQTVKKERTKKLKFSSEWLAAEDLAVIGRNYGITFVIIEIQENILQIVNVGEDNSEKVIYLVNETKFNPPISNEESDEKLEDSSIYDGDSRQGAHYDLLLPKEIDKLGTYIKTKRIMLTDNYEITRQYYDGFSFQDVDTYFSDEKFNITER